MNTAESIARVTGSRAATVTTQRRLSNGELVVESVESFSRIVVRDGLHRSGCCDESLTRPGHEGSWHCASCDQPQQHDMPRSVLS